MSTDQQDPRIARGMKAQLARLHERLAAGEKSIGWKLAFSSPDRMRKFALMAPLTGFLTDKAVVASGTLISLAGWTKAIVEAEIAVHIGSDLPHGADREAVKRAIKGIGPAIELVDSVRPSEDIEQILAGNISQRGVVLGPCDATRAGGRLNGVRARVSRNGKEIVDTTDPEALPGELIGLVGCVAERLAECGEMLRAGQVIITGSIAPPLVVDAVGEDIVFDLDPIGMVSIRFLPLQCS